MSDDIVESQESLIKRLSGELDRTNERWLDLMAENEDLRNRLIAEQDRNAILMSDKAILQHAVGEEGRANRMTFLYESLMSKVGDISLLHQPVNAGRCSCGREWWETCPTALAIQGAFK